MFDLRELPTYHIFNGKNIRKIITYIQYSCEKTSEKIIIVNRKKNTVLPINITSNLSRFK